MKETKQQWYLDVSSNIYQELYTTLLRFRLTDSQLAKLISDQYGGDTAKHIANIRRSQCNDRNQPYSSVPDRFV